MFSFKLYTHELFLLYDLDVDLFMMVFANETHAWAFPKLKNFRSSEMDWAMVLIVLIVFTVGSKPLCATEDSLYKKKENMSMAHAF